MNVIKDQRGFTIIELVTSFSLTMVVLIFLFNIVLIMKETYFVNTTKSDLIVDQSLLSTALSEDLYNDATSFKMVTCSSTQYNYCFLIGTNDGNMKLNISTEYDKIIYGDTIYSGEDFDVTSVSVCKKTYSSTSSSTNSYLQIKIGIDSSSVEDYDFSINVVHLYDSSSFTVTSISDC